MIAKQYLNYRYYYGSYWCFNVLNVSYANCMARRAKCIFEALLGKWAPDGVMDADIYLALVTIHGTIMVFFVLTAGLSGTFSNLLIPLQIGARDMASGFLNMVSYWLFFLSSVIMVISYLLKQDQHQQVGPFIHL